MSLYGRFAIGIALAGWMMAAGGAAWGQRTSSGSIDPPVPVPSAADRSSSPSLGSGGADDAMRDRRMHMEVEMERTRNNERQKKLVADTEKLLTLANELKVDVDKSTKDMLSLDVIRKADEIEKLAHSVRERMKAS